MVRWQVEAAQLRTIFVKTSAIVSRLVSSQVPHLSSLNPHYRLVPCLQGLQEQGEDLREDPRLWEQGGGRGVPESVLLQEETL